MDAWSNLTNIAGVSTMPGCSSETLNAAPATSKNQLTGFTYDAAGDLTSDSIGNTPTYDGEGRIVTDAGVTYSYDADGTRVKKSSGTVYWPDTNGNVLAESDLSGNINAEYMFFDGKRIARIDRPSGAIHYYYSDILGSATVIADASANIQEQDYYYPYGGLHSVVGSDTNHYIFTGKERDSENNLDNFGFRYFESSLGRFVSTDDDSAQDAANPQSWNLYSYVMNRPTIATDPDGHDCVYTSSQTSKSVTVTVERGPCSDANNGTYISGTIDVNSLTYNGQTGDLGYSLDNGGVGVVALNAPPQPGQLSTDQVQILSQAGSMGTAGVKYGAIQMATDAIGIGLGRLAATGAEAVMAGRAAKAAEEAVPSI